MSSKGLLAKIIGNDCHNIKINKELEKHFEKLF